MCKYISTVLGSSQLLDKCQLLLFPGEHREPERGSSQGAKENQRECAYSKLGKEKTKQKRTEQSPFLGVEESSPGLPCLVWTDVFDVPREDPEALQDFKLPNKSSKRPP